MNKISVRSGMMALLGVVLVASACKPPKDHRTDDGKMAGTETETMNYTHQNSARISPDGSTVLVDLGNEGFAWYSLPDGKELYRAADYSGVDLLGFAGSGLNWLEAGSAVSLDKSGQKASMPLPEKGQWRSLSVSASNESVTAINYEAGRTHLYQFRWGNSEYPVASLEIPKTDRNFLAMDAHGSMVYVKGSIQIGSMVWEGILSVRENEFQLLHEYGPGPQVLSGAPAFGHGAMARGLPGAVLEITEREGNVRKLPGDSRLQSLPEVRFTANGKSILSVGVTDASKSDENQYLIRLTDLESGNTIRETSFVGPPSTQFFTDDGGKLHQLQLDLHGKPRIQAVAWQMN